MEYARATTADAEVIMQLYDLRREPEMRKARYWFGMEFSPNSFPEFEQIMMNFGSQESRWLSQVISYWEMAAALANRGALHGGLFYDTCTEGWLVYAKLKPFLQECRTKFSQEFLIHLERAIETTPSGRERLQLVEQHLAQFRAMAEKKPKLEKVA